MTVMFVFVSVLVFAPLEDVSNPRDPVANRKHWEILVANNCAMHITDYLKVNPFAHSEFSDGNLCGETCITNFIKTCKT